MEYYIGHATNKCIRYQASSGGIGSVITKYLLSLNEYGTSISFMFDKEKCMYQPKLIYKEEDLNICGSIYQDINLIDFIKNNIKHIKKGIIVTCAPCQVKAIRFLLNKSNIKNFIISFSCSGQTTIEGTWCFYKFAGIKKDDIINMQYRGNGWPSGIQVWTKNGDKEFFKNYTEPWKTIHESWLFRPHRCFYCINGSSNISDISIADPWLEEYTKNDKVGNTLIKINTKLGKYYFSELFEKGLIKYIESDYYNFYLAQKNILLKGVYLNKYKRAYKILLYFSKKKGYKKWASSSLHNMKIHNMLYRNIKKIFKRRFL